MAYILLSKDKRAIVDDNDVTWLSAWSWSFGSNGYAYRKSYPDNKTVYMHRQITGYQNTDHINRDRLDNRRLNLRESTQSQNCHNSGMRKNNTSGYKGVCRNKRAGKWIARIMIDRKLINIGYFRTREEASAAYERVRFQNGLQ